ncbi:hypothetical protein NC661_18475 [Aquibacillus koreensis]|uniref:Uncharacterized protein n=1 Tax=Aquibacillus koreensis TaxID=279446 RepID=A0A9X3WRF2_9BACI|nr:hypothetical protein [Aquibacillus koreensis]MCT2537005.1 hypothetical protein [Aquibacillus koreensis]MDC3422341.1 hypothetical protein [Aquibacillus koreensis]
MRRQQGLLIIGVAIAFIIFIVVFIMIQLSPSHQAKEIVEAFYVYEEEGKFADSWDLFHSQMKSRFDKAHYIQDRAHVFMNHFGVTTFSFELSGVNEMNNWKMSSDAKPIGTVYEVVVTQSYKGDYGNFSIVQSIYATKEEGDWKVLWDYNK